MSSYYATIHVFIPEEKSARDAAIRAYRYVRSGTMVGVEVLDHKTSTKVTFGISPKDLEEKVEG